MQPVGSVPDLLAILARGSEVRDEPELDGLAHALQCGAILRAEAPDDPELAVAGLVHDIADVVCPDDHTDHDRRGAELVEPLLGARVARLVGAHVLAKRYLVTTDPAYRNHLSLRSVETLAEQGDSLRDAELTALASDPDRDAILELRRADERAKDPHARVPGLETWRELLEQVAALKPSISFDRIADTYDATRGGFVVGRIFAEAAAAHLPHDNARVVELGVGTGLVAAPLTERGHTVLGIDLSPKMIAVARNRIGARVAIGDASRTPIASASCDAVVAARVLHVVGDPAAVLADAARIVRRGGSIIVILAGASRLDPTDDIDEAVAQMRAGRLRGPDADETIALAATLDALELIAADRTEPLEFDESPRDYAEKIRARTWSGFWEIDNETWARTSQPAIDRLLALPEPGRPRRRQRSHRVLVFSRR